MSSAKVPECITGGCVCGNCRYEIRFPGGVMTRPVCDFTWHHTSLGLTRHTAPHLPVCSSPPAALPLLNSIRATLRGRRCDNCRKRGTLVATNLAVPEANFAWTSSTTLKEFPPNSPEGHALFCSNCGSCFAGWKKGHGNAVPVGTIDREFLMGPGGQLLAEPKLHFFTEREIKNVTDEGVMSRGKRMNKMFE